jgi:hypothetical protein
MPRQEITRETDAKSNTFTSILATASRYSVLDHLLLNAEVSTPAPRRNTKRNELPARMRIFQGTATSVAPKARSANASSR